MNNSAAHSLIRVRNPTDRSKSYDDLISYKDAMKSNDSTWHDAMKSEIQSVQVIKFGT